MDRLNEITSELVELMGELQRIQKRTITLVSELELSGMKLPPEIKSMMLAMKPNTVVKIC